MKGNKVKQEGKYLLFLRKLLQKWGKYAPRGSRDRNNILRLRLFHGVRSTVSSLLFSSNHFNQVTLLLLSVTTLRSFNIRRTFQTMRYSF